jgi:hypothetical protein
MDGDINVLWASPQEVVPQSLKALTIRDFVTLEAGHTPVQTRNRSAER